jgi:HK97 family phage prohead protease
MNKQLNRAFAHGLTVRAGDAAPNSIGTLDGYAAVFDQWTKLFEGRNIIFNERIAPGAFRDSLARNDDIRALFNHDSASLLGRRSSGTLELGEDAKGLRVAIHLPDTQVGRDTLASVKRGDLTGMSFGFYIRKQSEQREEAANGGKAIIRTTIEAADLIEVSPVTFPAYPQTELAARSLTPDQLAAMEALDKPAAKPGISARTAWLINSWKLSQ